jgi:NAD(P)-dependent dehydrogenase (short-subunit alcohol dehydrogenase family)
VPSRVCSASVDFHIEPTESVGILMRGLTGKVIAVSGGAGDLGLATAQRLAEEGAIPYLLDVVDTKEGLERANGVKAAGYYLCSQTDRKAFEKVIAEIIAQDGRLDVLILNAARTSAAGIAEMDIQEWREIIDLNLNGPVECSQVALRLMLKQPRTPGGSRGKILFTGTQCQQRPEHGGVGYQVSKRALQRFMEQLAYDYAAEGVLSNMLLPGILNAGLTRRVVLSSRPDLKQTLLDRIPIGEFGTSEQVAAAYAYLCSSDSDYMTGACLTIDGGCVLGRAER